MSSEIGIHPAGHPLYERLVREHAAGVWRIAYRLTGDRDDAEDLTQEAFYEAWRSIGSLRAEAAGRAWLVAILMHRASRRLRTVRREPPTERPVDAGVDAAQEMPAELDLTERQEEIQDALDALSPERRAVFVLVFLEGLTCREVGELLDIPLGTVLSRIHRARGELRWHLRHLRSSEADRTGAEQRDRGSA